MIYPHSGVRKLARVLRGRNSRDSMAKIVFISHPVRGDIKKNVESAIQIMKAVHTKDILPLAPYLESMYYLDPGNSEDNDKGMEVDFEILRKRFVDELWLCGPRISEGMRTEIQICLEKGIPVVCYNPELTEDLEKIKSKFEKR